MHSTVSQCADASAYLCVFFSLLAVEHLCGTYLRGQAGRSGHTAVQYICIFGPCAQNEAIYLVTNGVAVECCRELLKQKLKGSPVPVHVVAFNVPQPSTIQFLKYLASLTGARFHAYQVQLQFELYEPMPYSDEMHAAPIGKKQYLAGWYPGDLVSGGVTARENLLAPPPKSPHDKGCAALHFSVS